MFEQIGELAEELPNLRAVLVTAMPDCLLFGDWARPDVDISSDKAAAYFGDLIRANHAGLKSMNSYSKQMQVTVESDDLLIVIREIRDNFVVTAVFDSGSPLGMVRLFVNRILESIDEKLPKLTASARPRGVLVVEFLRKYAPDPHAVLRRASLRAKLPMALLRSPRDLNEAQVAQLETVAKELLGLDELHI